MKMNSKLARLSQPAVLFSPQPCSQPAQYYSALSHVHFSRRHMFMISVLRLCWKESTEVRITQKNSYWKVKRFLDESHTQTHGNLNEKMWNASQLCFSSTYITIETMQRWLACPCARMTRKIVKRSTFFRSSFCVFVCDCRLQMSLFFGKSFPFLFLFIVLILLDFPPSV